VKGKTLDEVLTITNSDIAKHLSLPPVKLHCSMLAEDAVKVRWSPWITQADHKCHDPYKLRLPAKVVLWTSSRVRCRNANTWVTHGVSSCRRL